MKKNEFFANSLHLFVLSGFAIAQPLFDLLSRNAEFFVARRSEPVDIFLLIFILCVLCPAGVVLLEAGIGLWGQKVRMAFRGTAVASLTAIGALQALKEIDLFSGGILVGIAMVMGGLLAVCYLRFQQVKMFFSVLTPAIIFFPALFVFGSPVKQVVFPEKIKVEAREGSRKIDNDTDTRPHIVMVVFDELPVTSLMNEQRLIDPIRYPHFASLAKDAYWFSNASTVHHNTLGAVPAILSGKYPSPSRPLPSLQHHPENLFTLFSASHALYVFETRTYLCPDSLNHAKSEPPGLAERMHSLLSDVSVVYLHVVLPSDLTGWLPGISQDWIKFRKNPLPTKPTEFAERVAALHGDSRTKRFNRFLSSIYAAEQPTLFFLHVLNPHVPWDHLPSDRLYSAHPSKVLGLSSRDMWSHDEVATLQGYQRHLLQVGYVDTMLGRVIKKLKDQNLYDQALIIVVADHGVSFKPNNPRRRVTSTTYENILPVPLLIKVPQQKKGVTIDRNVETIDILPTMADVLNMTVPWPVNGHSVLRSSFPEREEKVIFDSRYNRFVFTGAFPERYRALERKLALFGSGKDKGKFFAIGPHKHLVGNQLDEHTIVSDAAVRARLDHPELFDHVDPQSGFVPAQITGEVTRDKNNGHLQELSTRHAPGLQYVLTPSEGEARESLARQDGKTFPVIPGAIKGRLALAQRKDGNVILAGWAADVKNFQIAEWIVVFVNGTFVYAGKPNAQWPDLVQGFGSPALLNAGFNFLIPAHFLKDQAPPSVRLFAISTHGRASELHYPAGYQWAESAKGGEQ